MYNKFTLENEIWFILYSLAVVWILILKPYYNSYQ